MRPRNVTENCTSWCTALLWIVPAKVQGTWQTSQGEMKLTQQFQMVTGSLGSNAIADGRLRGDQISFTAGGVKYTGYRVRELHQGHGQQRGCLHRHEVVQNWHKMTQ